MAIPPPDHQAGSVCAESMSNKLTGLKLSKVKLSKIKPYSKNPRVISDRAIATVAKSLEHFGWQQPLVLNAQEVIGVGHTRFFAAQKIQQEGGTIPNWPDTAVAPVFYANNLTAKQFKAYRIADNKTGELTDWEFPTLSLEMTALQNEGFDLSLIGFDENELEELFPVPLGEYPDLPDGDKTPFQQMTFTLHDEQAELVSAALGLSKDLGEFDKSLNENSNGNALARICDAFVRHDGDG